MNKEVCNLQTNNKQPDIQQHNACTTEIFIFGNLILT